MANVNKKPATTTDVHGYQGSVEQEKMGNRKPGERTNNMPSNKSQDTEKSHKEGLKGPLSGEGKRSGTDTSQ